MAVTQKINSKANIKNTTDKDLPFSPQLPVVARYEATSTASQTIINMSFSVDQSNTDAFMLHVDGKLLRPGASNDYTFTSVAVDNTSSQVTLNSSIPVNLNIVAIKLGVKRELEFQMDNRFVSLYEAQDQGFQGFVKNTLMNATTTTGTPAAGTFYSSIINRSAMIDLSQDLKTRFGVNRMAIQQIFQLQNEIGPNGEIIWGAANDDRNQIRFVGSWTSNIDSSGQSVSTITSGDYLEVTFYGTGLDILLVPAASMNFTSATDGGSASANLALTYSTILTAQFFSSNTVVNVVSGLTLGVHTVKVANAAVAGLKITGVQTLNVQATIQANSGIAYIQGKKITTGSATTWSSSTSVTGTKGGRMLVYQASDGTISRSFQATDASSLNLSSTSHTNEEVARSYHWREFGASRVSGNDDFSTLTTTESTRMFVLEDGTTGMVGQLTRSDANQGGLVYGNATNDFLSLTFVGTGLDVELMLSDGAALTGNVQILIDGTSIFSGTRTSLFGANRVNKIFKVVSGLAYGTHTVKFLDVTAGTKEIYRNFIVYQPKKPTVPSGAIELADYNVVADFVANATAGQDTIATGVVRKASIRELIYSGSWSVNRPATVPTGHNLDSSTNGDFFQYTFFGTGFDIRFTNDATSATWIATLDGSTNLSGFSNAAYGAGVSSWTPATGTLVTSTSATSGNGLRVSGLTLGLHTIKLTKSSGAGTLRLNTIDIITPVHSAKSNLNYDQQNSLPVGSQAISDNRKFSPIKDIGLQKKNVSQADGLANSPTTTSASFVPMPDMSVAHYNTTGKIRVSYDATIFENTNTNDWETQVFIDGIASGGIRDTFGATTQPVSGFQTRIFNVSPGFHKVDVHWKVLSGSGQVITAYKTSRMLLVEEI